jgi:hypothetical protein
MIIQNRKMSGPLIVCYSCNRELGHICQIVQEEKAKKLGDTVINEMLQENLLGDKIYEIYQDFELAGCCRVSMTNIDFSSQIYG